MLPSNPRLGSARGLPSNPRLRSQQSRVPDADLQSSSPSSSHPDRSLEHSLEPTSTLTEGKKRLASELTRIPHASTASTTSSRLLNPTKHAAGAGGSVDLNPAYRSERRDQREENLPQAQSEVAGTGEAIWNRVATIASSLTVSVSQAWASNITTYAGEETPPGQESRLTLALKAYHLEKARDPADLPPWLFGDNERRPPLTSPDGNSSQRTRPLNEAPPGQGLREVYDTYRSELLPSRAPKQPYKNLDPPPPSKAGDRLKALREAKRTGANPTFSSSDEGTQPQIVDSDFTAKSVAAVRPRVGLPSTPRRKRDSDQ
ncbi:hypothetical protein H0H93_014511 [Arthromyces matolae]|nr:hypothetical protein H0H93_014511 [Arthromyces matolae]